jgi:hypothetical protein
MEKDYFGLQNEENGPTIVVDPDYLTLVEMQLPHLNEFNCYNWIRYENTKYHTKDFIIRSNEKFAEIKAIITSSTTKEIYFLVEKYTTIRYITQLTGFLLEENQSLLKIMNIKDLHHYKPLDSYLLEDNTRILVPKYKI